MKKNKKVKKSKTKNSKKINFLKLLIRLSMKHAESSHDSIKDFFMAQAIRLDSELEKLETGTPPVNNTLQGTS